MFRRVFWLHKTIFFQEQFLKIIFGWLGEFGTYSKINFRTLLNKENILIFCLLYEIKIVVCKKKNYSIHKKFDHLKQFICRYQWFRDYKIDRTLFKQKSDYFALPKQYFNFKHYFLPNSTKGIISTLDRINSVG